MSDTGEGDEGMIGGSSSSSSERASMSDTVYGGRYHLQQRIALGVLSEVYSTHDSELDRQLAIKILSADLADDADFVKSFRRDVKAAANLDHPNIVSIHDWGLEHGNYYVVMEYVDGSNAEDMLSSEGPIDPDRAAELGVAVASALSSAHEAKIVHRNLTLSNVLVNADNEVKVNNFGVADALDRLSGEEAANFEEALLETASYFSPEQAQGRQLDGRSDLYSLGVGLYKMVTDKLPFTAENSTALAVMHVKERPIPPRQLRAEIAESLEAIILKLLAKNPAHRYPTAADLKADLEFYLAGAHSLNQQPTRHQKSEASKGKVSERSETPEAPKGGETSKGVVTDGIPLQAKEVSAHTEEIVLKTLNMQDEEGDPQQASVDEEEASAVEHPTTIPIGVEDHPAQPDAITEPVAATVPSTAVHPQETHPHPTWLGQPGYYGPPTYYYEEAKSSGSWVRTVLTVLALLVLLATLGYLGFRFYKELGLDDNDVTVEDSMVVVPDIKNFDRLNAEAQLRNLGLDVNLRFVENAAVDEDTVFAQDPPAGQRVERGELVTITVSRDELHIVPSVEAHNVVKARELLEEAGYRMLTLSEVSQAEVGIVFNQEPAAGAKLRQGNAVTVYVSTGPGLVFIPDVRGLANLEAIERLTDMGFRVEERLEVDSIIEKGLVIDTEPTVGSPVERSFELTLIVSDGQPLTQVPDVLGVRFDTAKLVLERGGFVLGLVSFEIVEADSADVSRILRQSPGPGEEAYQGTSVDVTVGLTP
ncbi:MAG: PASTA domain-containing protein [Acidimicrobiaceae bacterium]|nr:PASTA domain-containing protein [Acidimicrobiaceae bacterium]